MFLTFQWADHDSRRLRLQEGTAAIPCGTEISVQFQSGTSQADNLSEVLQNLRDVGVSLIADCGEWIDVDCGKGVSIELETEKVNPMFNVIPRRSLL